MKEEKKREKKSGNEKSCRERDSIRPRKSDGGKEKKKKRGTRNEDKNRKVGGRKEG